MIRFIVQPSIWLLPLLTGATLSPPVVAGGQPQPPVRPILQPKSNKADLVIAAKFLDFDTLAVTISNAGGAPSANNRYVIEATGRGLGNGTVPVLRPGDSIAIGPLKLAPATQPLPIIIRLATPDGGLADRLDVVQQPNPQALKPLDLSKKPNPVPPPGPIQLKTDPKFNLFVGTRIVNNALELTITNRDSHHSAPNRYTVEGNGRVLGNGAFPSLKPGESIAIAPIPLAPSPSPVAITVRIPPPFGMGAALQATVVQPAGQPGTK